MALTLEKLFEAYESDDQDFASDVYNWFGLEEGGIGAEDFSDKSSSYLPTYDPNADRFAYEDKALTFRNAAEVHNLAKKATEQAYSEEMEKISGTVGKEFKTGRQVAGSLGLKSGSLESALENTLTAAGSNTEDLSRRLLLQKEEDLNAYNVKMVDGTLDYEKDIHDNQQAFFDRTMAAVDRIRRQGGFDSICEEGQVLCSDGSCKSSATECPGHVDICGVANGTATSETECEGYTTPEQNLSACEDICHASLGTGADGRTCIETCQEGTFTTRQDGSVASDFDRRGWWEDNYDYIQMTAMCRDEERNWFCPEDEEESLGCLGCMNTDLGCNSYDVGTGTFSACDPECCGG